MTLHVFERGPFIHGFPSHKFFEKVEKTRTNQQIWTLAGFFLPILEVTCDAKSHNCSEKSRLETFFVMELQHSKFQEHCHLEILQPFPVLSRKIRPPVWVCLHLERWAGWCVLPQKFPRQKWMFRRSLEGSLGSMFIFLGVYVVSVRLQSPLPLARFLIFSLLKSLRWNLAMRRLSHDHQPVDHWRTRLPKYQIITPKKVSKRDFWSPCLGWLGIIILHDVWNLQ